MYPQRSLSISVLVYRVSQRGAISRSLKGIRPTFSSHVCFTMAAVDVIKAWTAVDMDVNDEYKYNLYPV